MSAQTETAATSKTPCACQAYEIELWTGEVPEGADPRDFVEYVGTGCSQTTDRIFAPGHDAKLKSLLIRAGAAGVGVRRGDVSSSAEQVSRYFGFEHQVLTGIKRAQAKMEAKAERKAAKAAAKSEPRAPRSRAEQKKAEEPKLAPATIKIGRWTYEALIDLASSAATFTSANGETKTVENGKYKLVEAK